MARVSDTVPTSATAKAAAELQLPEEVHMLQTHKLTSHDNVQA
jgi:hypothetical protein